MVGQIEGEATIRIEYDTQPLGPQMRRAVRQAGAAGEDAGDAYADEFTKAYTPEMKAKFAKAQEARMKEAEATAGKGGQSAGRSYTKGMSQQVARDKTFDSAFNIIMSSNSRSAATGGERSGRSFSRGFGRGLGDGGGLFNVLDQQARAIALVIAATLPETSALVSGLSSNIVALGAGLVGAAAGASTFAAVLPGLAYGIGLAANGLSRVEELAPKASEGINNLKNSFENLDVPAFMKAWEDSLAGFTNALAESLANDKIAENLGGAFAGITDALTDVINSPAWTSFVGAMETSIPAALEGLGVGIAGLASAFLSFSAAAGPVAQALGEEFAAWGQSIAETMQAANESGELTAFLETAADTLRLLLDLTGSLSGALGGVFTAATPAAQTILGIFGDLAAQFDTWANSLEGQSALAAWFDQGIVILEALLPLVGAVATTLADLITPEVVTQLTTFLGSLTALIPIVGQVLGLFSQMNVLGIVAALFDAIRVALEPVMPQLGELATALGQALIDSIVALSPLLTAVVAGIAAIAPVIAELLPPLVDLIAQLGESLTPLVERLSPILVDLLEAFIPLIPMLADLLIPAIELLAVSLEPILSILGTILPPIIALLVEQFRPFIDLLTALLKRVLPPLTDAADWFTDSMDAMKPVVDIVTTAIKRFGEPIDALIDGLKEGKSWADAFRDAGARMADIIGTAISRIKSALQNISWPQPPAWITQGFGAITNAFATGGLVQGPTRALIGEAGPEMVVPLARPLSQVDPAVRDVAAYAQGKMPAMARGGVVGGGVSVENVTIMSPWANNPRLIAEDFLDALVLEGK